MKGDEWIEEAITILRKMNDTQRRLLVRITRGIHVVLDDGADVTPQLANELQTSIDANNTLIDHLVEARGERLH